MCSYIIFIFTANCTNTEEKLLLRARFGGLIEPREGGSEESEMFYCLISYFQLQPFSGRISRPTAVTCSSIITL